MPLTKELYKFFFDYLKIYKSTSDSIVSKWKLGDLTNALSWSSICEQIYSKIKNKKSYKKLFDEIDLFKLHWKIDESEENVVEIFGDASMKIKKVKFSILITQ